ncbi:hypothetical protein COO60DRAFT_1641476 [Scenedesmus sp. NREL 46B-D3]|nr:hypothetical protein COO60DRAFT_1641476 [Scenedesmus sp. NREL 46B-D3]
MACSAARDKNDIWTAEEAECSGYDEDANDGRLVPEFELRYKQAVTTSDNFLGMSGKDPSSCCCEELLVVLQLPQAKSAADGSLQRQQHEQLPPHNASRLLQGLQNAAAAGTVPDTTTRSSSSSGASTTRRQQHKQQQQQQAQPPQRQYQAARSLIAVLLSSGSGSSRPCAFAAIDKLKLPPSRGSGPGAAQPNMGPPLAAKHKLAGAMRELGYSCSASADTFKALLQQYAGRLDEHAVAEVLGLLAATHRGLEADALGLADAMRAVLSISGPASSGSAGSANSWTVPVIMDGIKAAAPSLSWPRVAEALDHEGFAVPDAAGFSILMAAWRRATTDPFPLAAIAGRVWSNAPGQLSLLVQAVAAPPDVLSWERTSKKIAPLDGMGQGKSPLGTPNQAWASLDLLTVLAQLAELPQLSGGVLELLRRGPASACPEVLVAATAFLRGPQDTSWGVLERFVWGSVAAPLLFDAPPSSSRAVLLARLWQSRSGALLFCMSEFLQERPGRSADLLDVVLEVKGLSSALDQAPPPLAVELAALAAQRKLLDLDKWLAGRLSRDTNSGLFMTASLTFLEVQLAAIADGRLAAAERAPATSGRGGAAAGGPGTAGISVLSGDLTTVFLRALYTAGASVVPGLQDRAFPAAEAALAAAAASQIGSGAAESGLAASGGGAFPEAIESEANSYFQKLYHERQPVTELVAQLKAFKTGTPHQQVVFACMVHNLFDEYRFFPNYPDLELDTTAALFGALLHLQLLTNITLGMALRHVLQALAQPPNSKMFRFGLGAISQFKPELHLWPKFCERALAIPHLKSVDAALCAYMEKVVRSGGDGSGKPAADGDLTGAASGSASGLGEGGSAEAAAVASDNKQASNSGSGGRAAGSVPNGVISGGSKAEQQQAAGGRNGKGGNAANGPADKAGNSSGPTAKGVGAGSSSTSKAAGGGSAAGAAGAGAGAGASGSTGASSLDTADNLREILSNATVAQAAATMALNDKPTHAGSFLMNNLTVDNMPSKSKDLGGVILPKYIEWFANYLEPNHHRTYVVLLDALAHKDLSKNVLSTTYYYCRALLESDRAITQTNERTLIKQLGSWLGLLTFAKNKPVLAKDMDLKQLVADAYLRGRMIAVLPFVEKVLSGCKDTKIHAMPRLKLNISFVIEMTFKTFEVSLADVCPSTALRDLPRVQMHNPDFSALPEAKAPAGAALNPALVPPGAPPALTPPPGAMPGAAGAAAGGAAAPPGTPPPPAAGAAAGSATPGEAGKGASGAVPASPRAAAAGAAAGTPSASPAGAAAGAAGAAASPAAGMPAAAAAAASAAEPGLLTKLHTYVQISPQLGVLAERLG